MLQCQAHGNFSEFVPLSLLVIAVVELAGSSDVLVHLMGAALVCSRCAHAYVFSSVAPPLGNILRPVGMVLTLNVIIIGSILCIVQYAITGPTWA